MKMSAHIQNSLYDHQVSLQTNGRAHKFSLAPKAGGYGSSVSGGELLVLALATCYCNDIYREANKRGIQVDRVEVDVEGDFEGEGLSASNVTYQARVCAQASEESVLELMRFTDGVAEIQNTLRIETPVRLGTVEAVSC